MIIKYVQSSSFNPPNNSDKRRLMMLCSPHCRTWTWPGVKWEFISIYMACQLWFAYSLYNFVGYM